MQKSRQGANPDGLEACDGSCFYAAFSRTVKVMPV